MKPVLRYIGVAAIFAAVVSLWLYTPLIVITVAPEMADKLPDAGLFGDLFGSVNALFSGLAFFGVVVALFWQREQVAKSARQDLFTSKMAAISAQLTALPCLIQAERAAIAGLEAQLGYDESRTWGNSTSVAKGIVWIKKMKVAHEAVIRHDRAAFDAPVPEGERVYPPKDANVDLGEGLIPIYDEMIDAAARLQRYCAQLESAYSFMMQMERIVAKD